MYFSFQLLITNTKPDEIVYPAEAFLTTELRDTQGNIRAYTYQANSFLWMHWSDLVTFRISRGSNRVLAVAETNVKDEFIEDLFWRNVLPFILQAQGWEAIHASAVKARQGIIAFCAAAGTGKSTIAYGFNQRSYPLWSDDSLVFLPSAEYVSVYPAPFKLRFMNDTRLHFDLTRVLRLGLINNSFISKKFMINYPKSCQRFSCWNG
jgi:hypothetical protein